jgi:hypothetical protein
LIVVVVAMSNWYFCKNGQQEGPISLDDLKGMIACGDLASTLPVWEIGTSSWIKVSRHPDLISSIPTPPPVPTSSAIEPARPTQLLTRILDTIRGSAIK